MTFPRTEEERAFAGGCERALEPSRLTLGGIEKSLLSALTTQESISNSSSLLSLKATLKR
jgi:hypothetical protein